MDFREAISDGRGFGGSFEWRCSFLNSVLPLFPGREDLGVGTHAIRVCPILIL